MNCIPCTICMKCKSVKEKERILFIVNLLISYKETRDFAKVERKQKGTQKRCFLKVTI